MYLPLVGRCAPDARQPRSTLTRTKYPVYQGFPTGRRRPRNERSAGRDLGSWQQLEAELDQLNYRLSAEASAAAKFSFRQESQFAQPFKRLHGALWRHLMVFGDARSS